MERDPKSPPALDLLRNAPLFRNVDDGALAAIYESADQRKAPQHAFLFHEGEPATHIHILIKGQVKLTQTTPEGHQVVVRVVSPGDVFAGVAAFGDTVYPATAQALIDCQCLVWDGKAMARIIERAPKVAMNVLSHLVDRVRELQDRYRELATERVERRVARTLLRLAAQTGRKTARGVQIDFPLSRQDLAEMTGTTLYTVSRILSNWEHHGLVDTGRERVTICSPHGLTAIAEDLPTPPEQPSKP